jgi:hypothetical protein
MSLSISATSNAAANATALSRPHTQKQKDNLALGRALASGDLASAQAAYAIRAQDMGSDASAHQNNGIHQVGAALQAGDLAGAQAAFAAMAMHNHKTQQGTGSNAQASAPAATGATDTTTNSIGSLLNTVA